MVGEIFKYIKYFLFSVLRLRRDRTKIFMGMEFCVNTFDSGGKYYLGDAPYKEYASRLYKLINPSLIIDVGANYGLMSIICAKKFPKAEVIAIEPDKRLCRYIKKNNCYINVINAICDTEIGVKTFAVNPFNSQDNRIKPPSRFWKIRKVETISLDRILEIRNPKFVFIKTDTQGYEKQVLTGGEKFLRANKNWLMKMEFAPYVLEQQGTDAFLFLEYLIDNYDVVDFWGVPYATKSISDLFRNKLLPGDIDLFISNITSLNHSGRGWIDLLIKPI